MTTQTPTAAPAIDLEAVKTRQQATWASGDYAVVGTTLQIVGETLCEALDLRAGSRVLDVAAGNGNASLAAARRFCQVTSTDYVPALLEKGRERATAERLEVEFKVADAERLPMADAEFDATLSVFGVMFTPDHARAAAEMARVTRAGGRIGLANWTPDSFVASSTSATARPITSSTSFAATTGRSTRRSSRCRPIAKPPSTRTCGRCWRASRGAATRWSCRATTSRP